MKNFLRMGTLMLLAVTFLFLLAACSSDDDENVGGPVAMPPPAGEAYVADEVVIGILAPLTGPAARFGIAVRDGAMLYIDGFNALGGLQIRPIIFDEEGDIGQAVVGYATLVDQGISALIGSVTSGPTMAVVPEANADGMPMITATSTHYNVTVDADGNVWNNVFRSCFIDPFQGTKMADFAHTVLGAQTAAILYSNDIDYSIGLMEAFVERAGELGLSIVATEVFAADAIDFVGQLTNIAAVNPDVLFVPAYVEPVALIGPQSVQAGLDTVILGADGWDGVLDIMTEGQRASLEGSFHMTGFTIEDETPMVQDFISRFTAATGNPPDMFSAQAYDAAMILISAIESALADGHSPDSDVFQASIIAHMAATNLTAVTGHITFDRYNNPQKTAVIIQFVNGEPRLWGIF
jgi:branched-chain amino acid transport system substrate-binding protein